jgi:hypothetical protein
MRVKEECMELHVSNFHQDKGDVRSVQIPTQRLPFVLLPPGTWNIQHVVGHYRNLSDDVNGGGFRSRSIEWTRLKQIESLRPLRCHVGRDSWLGYVVFEFASFKRVVLECPIEGNATYVLSGDWKRMVSYTKGELRERFARRYEKVVHKGDWLARVRQALRGGW